MVSTRLTHPRRVFCVTSKDPDTTTGLAEAGSGVTSGLGGVGVAGAASPNSWPHDWQNLAFGATSLPHRPQNVTRLAGGGVTFQVCHPFPEGVGRHRTPRCRYAQRLKGRRMASRSGCFALVARLGGRTNKLGTGFRPFRRNIRRHREVQTHPARREWPRLT